MKVIIDTREQLPLPFKKGGLITGIINEGLDVADYACEFEDGHRPNIFFERKTIADLFGTMTSGYKRFKAEYERFAAIADEKKEFWLYTESTLLGVADGFHRSEFPGESMIKKLFTLLERYKINLLFMPDRAEAMEFMIQRWAAYGREYMSNKGMKNVRVA